VTSGNALPSGSPQLRENWLRRGFSVIEGFSAGTHGFSASEARDLREFVESVVVTNGLLLGGAFDLAVEQLQGEACVSATAVPRS
jgi:hypothetical protein